jgi:hypothetical protein
MLTLSEFESIILNKLHPTILKTILFDSHIEFRLEHIEYLEQDFKQTYHTTLFMHFNKDSKTITYHNKNTSDKILVNY